MTLLVRGIAAFADFKAANDQDLLTPSASDPIPIVALREFVPSQGHGELLSVFEVDDEDDCLKVAAAFATSTTGLRKDSRYYLAARKSDVQALGLEFVSSAGKLDFPNVDAKHLDIRVKNHDDAARLARVFLAGEHFVFQAKALTAEVVRASCDNEVDFSSIAGKDTRWKNLGTFVAERRMQVSASRPPSC